MNDLSEIKTLSEVMSETMGLRGFNAESLAEMSDIPVRYINAFLQGDFSKLPATPYIKGYLAKIAEVLNLNQELLLEIYRRENSTQIMKSSGAHDRLPFNRFAAKSINKTLATAIIIAIVLAGFFIFRFNDFFGTPGLEITSPSLNNLIIEASSIKLAGRISNPRDKLTINGEEILIGGNGFFEHDFSLQSGVNTVEFKVSRFLGEEFKLTRQIIYQPLQ